MLANLTYYSIFGLPLILYLGVSTLFIFGLAALFGFLAMKGKVPLKWHHRVVAIAFALAVIHGLLGILAYI